MINIFDFYKENVSNNEYYYKFYDRLITDLENKNKEYSSFIGEDYYKKEDFDFFDNEDIINKFRILCQPENSLHDIDAVIFLLVCFYLYKTNYKIEQFPRLLQRPPEEPMSFIYNDIRNYAISHDMRGLDGKVTYDTRRIIVAKLIFNKTENDHINLVPTMEQEFIKISTRSASFEQMAIDEKIEGIINLIENMLKETEKSKYINIDYDSITAGFIKEDNVKDYRHKLQCFRHNTREALEQRKKYNIEQKKVIIDYGITICNLIYRNIRK